MLTRCPQCETIFRVSKKHISAAKGLVRCGSCKDIFNAKEHVIKSKKDLKKPVAKTESTTAQAKTNATAEKKPATNKVPVNNEIDGFDFINDGFTSTGEFKRFDSKEPIRHKKPTSKPEALNQGKSTNYNFNSVFEDEAPKINSEDVFIIKKPDTQKNSIPGNVSRAPSKASTATFKTKTPQPHQATVVKKSNPDKLTDKAGNFISQNVIDIKNAFSFITKKISTKVANKIQPAKQSDAEIKKSLVNKLSQSKVANQVSPVIVETSITETKVTTAKASVPKNPAPAAIKKPRVMSINSETDIYSSSKNTVSVEPEVNKKNSAKINKEKIITEDNKSTEADLHTSAPKIKPTPKLKEDVALKLAILLKKAAQEKTNLAAIKTSDNKVDSELKPTITAKADTPPITGIKKPKQDSKSSLNVVQPKVESKPEISESENESEPNLQLVENKLAKKDEPIVETNAKPKNEDAEKHDTKEPNLIANEDLTTSDEPEENMDDDDLVHIHMQTVDIPMVLRESLEELDLPTRSIEMTLFMIVSLVVLCLGLLLQFSVFRSIEVQQSYPSLKPLVTKICKTFTCDYSGPRDIKKIQLISRDIRVHPTTKGALLISATIINNANYQQPYPNFSVNLSNLGAKTIAQRFFTPKDYLGTLSKKLLLMPPKQPIRVALEVVDPGKAAINFEFKFIARK